MLNKRILLILFLLFIAIGAISAVNASDFAGEIDANASADELGIEYDNTKVNNVMDETGTGESEEGVLSVDDDSFRSLQNKINSASEGSTVYLDNDYEYKNDVNGITITKSLTINGRGHSIDGLSKSMIFHIEGAQNVVLKNINFKNGLNNEYGGAAIYSKQSNVNIDSCTFDFNIALNGGCIYALNSKITANNCYFENSGVLGAGGAICSLYSDLIFSDTHFSKNFGQVAGGDIFSHGGALLFSDSSFSDSYSGGMGGSISSEEGTMTFNNCNFYNCTSHLDGGGAIYCLNSSLECILSEFEKCQSFFGGAICCLNSDLKIMKNNFYNNVALFSGGSVYTIYGTVSVSDSIFDYSYAMMYGGSMYLRSPHAIYDIKDNYFLYSHSIIGPRVYVDSFYGDIPESGSIIEDVVFVIANFRASETAEEEYSNVITYVISNSGDYINDMDYYEELRENFILKNNISMDSSQEFNLKIFDEDFPDNDFILLNYADFDNHTISYDLTHTRNDFDYRLLSIDFYDVGGTQINYLDILALVGEVNQNLQLDCNYSYVYISNNDDDNGWWTRPVFEDESRIMPLNTPDHWACILDENEFNFTGISGEFIFNFKDRSWASNYGNAYEFQSIDSTVPIIDSGDFINYLPSHYDSRDYGYVTPVQDQSTGGNCWAFAGISTLETCIKKIMGEDYDFSEDNAKNLMAISSIYGLNIETNKGGYDTMFMGYLTSWLGPTLDQVDTYNPISSLSQPFYSLFHIQDITFLPTRQNSEDNDEYKKAILNYGAICVTFDYGVEEYHAVSIVGWDDDYNNYDSLGNYAKGAWIFKNSWGDDWGDNGFGYLSYEQELSGQIDPSMHTYTFVFSDDDDAYQDIYQYDFAGVTNYIYCDEGPVYYKNKFTAKDKEFLCAFSTYFESETDFTFSVRINGKDIDMTDEGELIETSICHASPGYHTIPLGYSLALNKGDEFEIIIKLLNSDENRIPICQADDLYKLSYPSGVSFISYNGRDWSDLYDLRGYYEFEYTGTKANTCQVACIKAFTNYWRYNSDESPYIEVANADIIETSDGSVLSRNYNIYQIGAELFEDYGAIVIIIPDWEYEEGVSQHYIKITLNDEVYYQEVTEEFVFFPFDFTQEGFFKFSAILQSNHYVSNLEEFNFISGDESNYDTFSNLKGIIDSAKEGSTIYLNKNYYLDDDFFDEYYFILIDKSLTIDGNNHILNGYSKSSIFGIDENVKVNLRNIRFVDGMYEEGNGGAIYSFGNINVYNCTFTGNNAYHGGAIYSRGQCYIEKSTFNSNSATNWGGSIYSDGECHIVNSIFKSNSANSGGALCLQAESFITGSTFEDNTADYGGAIDCGDEVTVLSSIFKRNIAKVSGGSIYLEGNASISNSNFESNNAKYGGAIFSTGFSSLDIVKSDFTYNEATAIGGSIYSTNDVSITGSNFKSNQNDMEILYYNYYYDENNVSYGELYLNNNKMESKSPAIYYGGKEPYKLPLYLVFNNVDAVKGDYVALCQVVDDGGNTFYVDSIDVTITNQNDKSKVLRLNVKYNVTLGAFGFDSSSLDYGTYELSGSISNDFAANWSLRPGILHVVKRYVITSSNVIQEYGKAGKVIITLREISGKAVANAYVDVNFNGKIIKMRTDANGQAILSVNLQPNTYYVTASYGDGGDSVTSSSKVVIKKAESKITANKKTFKRKVKTKKYAITLKDSLGRAIKNAKVTLKIKGKTYKATTNSKGKATFKIKNLKKKGKFKGTVKFAGNAYYNAVSKKVQIIVKK